MYQLLFIKQFKIVVVLLFVRSVNIYDFVIFVIDSTLTLLTKLQYN